MEWHLTSLEKPEHSGYYLIAFESQAGRVSPDIGRYYHAGETIAHETPMGSYKSPREVLKALANSKPIIAEENGFYTFNIDEDDNILTWEIRPLFWAELPDPPVFRYDEA